MKYSVMKSVYFDFFFFNDLREHSEIISILIFLQDFLVNGVYFGNKPRLLCVLICLNVALY